MVEGIEHTAWVYFNEKQGSLIKSGNYDTRRSNY